MRRADSITCLRWTFFSRSRNWDNSSNKTPSFRPIPGMTTSSTPACCTILWRTIAAGKITSARSGRKRRSWIRSSILVARSFLTRPFSSSAVTFWLLFLLNNSFRNSPSDSILPPVPTQTSIFWFPISCSSRRCVASTYSVTSWLNRSSPAFSSRILSRRTLPMA